MCEISQILTDFCKVVVALKCMYCIFLIYMLVVLYSPVVAKIVTVVFTGCYLLAY